MRLSERLEYATAADPARNYCLWDYVPVPPVEDNFRSVNLLYQSFEVAGVGGSAYEIVDAIRDAIGAFQTVFGIKLIGDQLSWELYFYDYERQQRQVSATRVLEAIAPWVPCEVLINELIPYFMVSIDLDAAILSSRRALEVLHLYIGNPGSTVSSGIAYALSRDVCRLENFYFFFDAHTQFDQVADKIRCSAHLCSSSVPIEAVLIPELCDCQTICVANKQQHDCVYFSGVTVDQLLYFLRRFHYPLAVQSFVSMHRQMFAHLLFDVGFDYGVQEDEFVVLKSGYYGVF